jgi:xylose isomerase
MASQNYRPDPKLKFTFGLWTVGNMGRDPFGEPTRHRLSVRQICDLLGEVGAYGVNFHDNDAIPIEATPAQAAAAVAEFKKAVRDNGLVVPMATTNLFSAIRSSRMGPSPATTPRCGRMPSRKRCGRWNMGAELGAKLYVFWGGRERGGIGRNQMPGRGHPAVSGGDQFPVRMEHQPEIRLQVRV